MKHINVALFVPDEGCRHRCSFCNQKTISGSVKRLETSDVDCAVETALKTVFEKNDGEIAFFGGSFTAIEEDYMISLLAAAKKYIDKGFFKGIRISTRPDCIDEKKLSMLKEYKVSSIELGCQSMNDSVLLKNERGHTAQDTVNASKLIQAYGFELGLQMMTGLIGDTDISAIETAKKIIDIKPNTVRIYPTVVLENTKLASLYRSGVYKPQTLEEATALCSKLLLMFHQANIPVIRLGLHSGGNVEQGFLAGAYHPAFRELCESRIYLEKIKSELKRKAIQKGEIIITVSQKYVSQLVGQNKSNIKALLDSGYKAKIIQNSSFEKYQIEIQEKRHEYGSS